jgi:hypothetical protein
LKNDLTPNARRLLSWMVSTSKRRVVPLAVDFIRREDGQPPPLAKLLRGGRGGDVRLKLYLSMNLLAVREPFDVRPLPARVWAEMLNLPNPETNGARRVNEALTSLEHQNLISLEDRRPGKPTRVYLLSHAGDGKQYSRPRRTWVNLPVAFWKNGWIVALSGRAIALFLILSELQGGRDPAEGTWVRPDRARLHYALSEDTWTRGVKELKQAHIVSVIREKHGERWDWVRLRNRYQVHVARLDSPP